MTSNNLHFGHFSDIPEYREVNRELVVQLLDRLPNPFVHVDVATGAGLVPQLLVEEATARNYQGTIIGLDRNIDALNLAREATPGTADVRVKFVEGDAREIPRAVEGLVPSEGADSVSIHDAIHEIDGEGEVRTGRPLERLTRNGSMVVEQVMGRRLTPAGAMAGACGGASHK